MNGVFACALQEILGAIKGIENPEPLRRQRLALCELLLRGLLTEQGPVGLGERGGKPVQQPRVNGQISRRNGALSAFIDTQGLGKTMRGLLAAGIGPQDIGGSPTQATQFRQQSLLVHASGENGRAGHHDQQRRSPL